MGQGNTMTRRIFVTGATGYIAKHLLVKLLNAGFEVVGSVRNLNRAPEIIAAVTPQLADASALDQRLRFVPLDLASDEGWKSALQGCDALMHTASPFPLEMPKDEDAIIRPAVDGALRAVRAARDAGIARVIMTSSTVAIMYRDLAPGQTKFTEDDWTDLDHPAVTPYVKSKTLAERAVWDFQRDEAPEMGITMINPAFVQGAPLDQNYGTSIAVIERLLRGKDPMLPQIAFPIVDVRDVAEMHLRALSRDETIGQRLIASDRTLWFRDMAVVLQDAFPDRKITTRNAPNFLIRLLARFDKSLASIAPVLGMHLAVSNTRARQMLDMKFIDSNEAVTDAAAFLINNKIV